MKKFQCRTRLCGWCSNDFQPIQVLKVGFNAARGFVGGAALILDDRIEKNLVSMPHAALWVVQHELVVAIQSARTVSMPHAALWVVQHHIRGSKTHH